MTVELPSGALTTAQAMPASKQVSSTPTSETAHQLNRDTAARTPSPADATAVRDAHVGGVKLEATATAPAEVSFAAAPTDESRSITQLKHDFQNTVQALAQRSPEQFIQVLKQVFGHKLDEQQLSALLALTQQGRCPLPAHVELVDSAVLQGNNAAYSPVAGGTIYLNKNLLADPQQLQAAFAEEAGHHLDRWLRGKDTPGDEGQMFQQALAKGGPLSETELAAAHADMDQGTISVQGQEIEVEFQAKLSEEAEEAVKEFVNQMSEWGVDAGDLQPAFDALNGLSWPDCSRALEELFRKHPAQVAEFFQEAGKEGKLELAQKVLEWMGDSRISAAAKNAFIHGMKGENFGYVLQALEKMDTSDRAAIVRGIEKNFGKDCWNAKLMVEALRAKLSGDTKGVALIGDALEWVGQIGDLIKNPVAKTILSLVGIYGQAPAAASHASIEILLKKLEYESHPGTIVGGLADGGVIKALDALFPGQDPVKLITQFRQGLNKWYGK